MDHIKALQDEATPQSTPMSTPGLSTITTLRDKQMRHSGSARLLIANRGEIAIRIARSAHEQGMQTIALYSHEDRYSAHRYKTDEAYLVGKGKTPVAAYLDQEDIIRIALAHKVDYIHPGYGFLSENADFADLCEQNGIKFVGPKAVVIDGLGNKTKARELALKNNVPVVPGSDGALKSWEEAKEFSDKVGFPIILKAAMGGGGRGMRVIRSNAEMKEGFERCVSEAKASFGDGTVFAERFLDRPRHIEVQILADSYGNVSSLFERDCSLQRRHQKVVEVAPAPNLKDEIRQAVIADAVKLAHAVNYSNAGTAEFLVDQQGRHYFLEVNPRIQVEHTITEEITGIDIVASQIQIAGGASLAQLGLEQEAISKRGFSIQCRITTEDAANGFQPDSGKIEVYRSAGGNGIRLDAANGYAGAQITPHYDSLLVKLTVRAPTYEIARRKMLRALVEFRIRGVKTNIPFLMRLLTHPVFITGKTWTTFIDDTPELFKLIVSQNRAQKILSYLGDSAVNGSSISGQSGQPGLTEEIEIPQLLQDGEGSLPIDTSHACTTGWRSVILNKGPAGFARAVREYPGVLIMDTTWRDAHQSLLATRMRTVDIARIAPLTSHALSNAYSLECWGGATFDTALRFLHECPWERLRTLRKLCPNIPLQALVRGANAVGYTSYPDNAIYEFSKCAVENGLDIFRIFDSLNYIENMKLGIAAAKAAGGVVEAAVCYSGDLANPKKTKYTLQYYLNFVQELVDCGIHVLGIKDMSGLLKPEAATMLIGAIRSAHPDLPIHVHSHDSAGIAAASMVACALAGADVVDVAIDSMSGLTSQPSMGAVCAMLEQSKLGSGISYEAIQALNKYWEQVRVLYAPFEAIGLRSSDSGIFETEMPGGQYSNLLYQASQLGLGAQWSAVKTAYKAANLLCGDIIKVTPSSKVVGDFAQFMVSNKLSAQDVIARAATLDFPTSVIEFFQGQLGQPVGGFPEPLRTHIIRDRKRIDGRPGKDLAPLDFKQIKKDLIAKWGKHIKDYDVQSYVQFPKVFEDYQTYLQTYGDLSILPTRYFLGKPKVGEEVAIDLEQGKTLLVKLIAVGPLDAHVGQRMVYFELNGETRAMPVQDSSAAIQENTREKAKAGEKGHVSASLSGVVIEVRVHEGQDVKVGDPVCILSAMKMESTVSAPVAGKVKRVLVIESDSIGQGDLICEIVHA